MTKIHKSRLFRSFNALVGILTTALAAPGCQTSGRAPNREVASTALSERTAALLRNDAYEAFGIAARGVLLEKRVGRAQVAAGLVPAIKGPSDWSSAVGEGFFMYGIASVATGCLGASVTGSLDGASAVAPVQRLMTQLATRFSKGDASGGAVSFGSVGGIVLGTSFGAFITAFGSLEDHRDDDGVQALHFIFRRGNFQADANRAADAQNAKAQTDFVAALKTSATDLARRWATLLRLSASETTSLEIEFEEKMLDAFQAKKNWRKGDEIKIDVKKILRIAVPDADERYRSLEVVVQHVSGGNVNEIRNVGEALAFYDEELKQLEALNAEILKKYKELHDSAYPAMNAIAKDYFSFSRDVIEKFKHSIELHRAFVAKEK